MAAELLAIVAEAAWAGRPFLVWSDGDDVTAVVGDEGEGAAEVLKLAARVLPEVGA